MIQLLVLPQSPFIGRRVPLVDNGVPILYPRYTSVEDILTVRARLNSSKEHYITQVLKLLAYAACFDVCCPTAAAAAVGW